MKYIIVASHRRSGTHWLIDTIFNNFFDVHHGYFNLDLLLPCNNQVNLDDFLKKHRERSKIVILKTHTIENFAIFNCYPQQYQFIQEHIIPNAKIVYIFRDGRDVLTSLYHFYMHEKNNKDILFKNFLLSKNDYDSICEDLNRTEFYCHHIQGWLQKESIIKVRYEDLHESYEKVIKELSNHLGLKHKQNTVKIGLKKYNKIQRGIRRIFPTLTDSTAILPRKGIIGDWKNNFDQESKNIFKKYSKNILVELKYVTNNFW